MTCCSLTQKIYSDCGLYKYCFECGKPEGKMNYKQDQIVKVKNVNEQLVDACILEELYFEVEPCYWVKILNSEDVCIYSEEQLNLWNPDLSNVTCECGSETDRHSHWCILSMRY